MERVNLEWLLYRATAYERWRAPFDARLRRSVALSGVCMLATLLILYGLPMLSPLTRSSFFLILRTYFATMLELLLQARPFIFALDLIGASVFVALLALTRGLREGRAAWHWLGFAEVAIGVFNGFVLALALAIVAINLALWLLIIAFVGGLLLGVLRRPGRLNASR
jgi:hypothetical protein